MADRGLAPAQELVNALMGRDPPKDPLFNPLTVGSYSLQRDQPNWFGTNVLGTLGKLSEVMPPGAFDAMSVVMPGAKGRMPRPLTAAMRVMTPEGERIFSGVNHGEAFDKAAVAVGGESELRRILAKSQHGNDLASDPVVGFVTQDGRYLTRSEASARLGVGKPEMTAEDIPF